MAEKSESLPTLPDNSKQENHGNQTDTQTINTELIKEKRLHDDDSGDEFVDAMDSLGLDTKVEPIQHPSGLVDDQGFLLTDRLSGVGTTQGTVGVVSSIDGASSVSEHEAVSSSNPSQSLEGSNSKASKSVLESEPNLEVTDQSSDQSESPLRATSSPADEEESFADAEEDPDGNKMADTVVTDIDEEALKERDEMLSEEQKQALRETAQEQKEQGNQAFKTAEYETAVNLYTKALRTCPLCYIKERSIMYSNRGACRLKQGKEEEAVHDCSKALELNPNYLKALLRRAEIYEKTDKLDEALADYQKAIEMDPGQRYAWEACQRLPEQINERNEKMKTEMMGKLKDLGNLILKPFGMSTENFKFQQDPNTGSYSVNFQQNPQQ